MDTNTYETDKIGMDMFYQSYITDYIQLSTEFKKNLRKSYTVI